MELQGTVHKVGTIKEKGTSAFKVAEVILDRKTIYQGQEYPHFTKVVFQGKKTELLEERNIAVGDYVKINGDLNGRYFTHQGEEKFAQDFEAWSLEITRKNINHENKKEEKDFC